MPWFDLPLNELRKYRTTTEEPTGLDQWWAQRIADANSAAKPPVLTRYLPEIYAPVEVYDVEFSGGGGTRIKAWYIRPAGADDGTPVLVKFIGYGGGRSVPADHMLLPSLGYALIVMDTRDQGGRWSAGATNPANSNVMTQHITSPVDYYYTHLFTDAARAILTAAEVTGAEKVAVTGASQGGALALAASALMPSLVRVCHADVPFLCDIQRAITLAPDAPFTEVPEFLAHNVDLIPAALDTLRYIDCALLARRITAECLLSTGLMDTICPPSTVFAAYNEITSGKDIAVHPYSDHSVPAAQVERQLRHLREHYPSVG